MNVLMKGKADIDRLIGRQADREDLRWPVVNLSHFIISFILLFKSRFTDGIFYVRPSSNSLFCAYVVHL